MIKIIFLFLVSAVVYGQSLVSWQTDESSLFTLDVMCMQRVFVGENSLFKLEQDHTSFLGSDTTLKDFKKAIRNSLKTLRRQEQPVLYINILGHGVPGSMVINDNDTLNHQLLVSTITSELDRFKRKYKKEVEVNFFYVPCYGASLFEAMNLLAQDYKINLFVGSSSDKKTTENTFYTALLMIGILNIESDQLFSHKDWAFYQSIRRTSLTHGSAVAMSAYGMIWSSYQEVPAKMDSDLFQETIKEVYATPIDESEVAQVLGFFYQFHQDLF